MDYKIDTYQDIPYNVDRSITGKILSGISWSTSNIIGFVVVLLIVFMTVVSALDLFYITSPFIHSLIRKLNWDGNRESGGIPIHLISKSAIRAVEKSYEANDGTTAIKLYLQYRVIDYFKAGIIIAILTFGVGPFADIIGNMIQPILKAFGFM